MNTIKYGSFMSMCGGKCGKSYKDCLKSRKVSLRSDKKEMKEAEKRNITPLFSRYGEETLKAERGVYKSFNRDINGGML